MNTRDLKTIGSGSQDIIQQGSSEGIYGSLEGCFFFRINCDNLMFVHFLKFCGELQAGSGHDFTWDGRSKYEFEEILNGMWSLLLLGMSRVEYVLLLR